MTSIVDVAVSNLLSPIVLFFVLGFVAALSRSDLSIPEAMAKALSLYLLFAIGFKGGAGIAATGVNSSIVTSLIVGVLLSAIIPLVAFFFLRVTTNLDRINAAAIAGHYGSISVVTFVTAVAILESRLIPYDGHMVAVAAIMEAPAIVVALWLASRNVSQGKNTPWREIILNGSVFLLIGALLIGWITGPKGLAEIESIIVSPFRGVLCLFLLDMGLVAGRGLMAARGKINWRILMFGLVTPVVGSGFGLLAGVILGLQTGSTLLLMVLYASASYIAVPAAMRVAFPKADPSIYLTLSLGITFPFNLTVGIPLYLMASQYFLTG